MRVGGRQIADAPNIVGRVDSRASSVPNDIVIRDYYVEFEVFDYSFIQKAVETNKN